MVDHVVVFSDSFSQVAILFLLLLDIEVVCFQEMLALKVQKLERNKLKSAIVRILHFAGGHRLFQSTFDVVSGM